MIRIFSNKDIDKKKWDSLISSSENESNLREISEELGIQISLIGKTNDSKAIRVFDKEGNNVPIGSGYSHF